MWDATAVVTGTDPALVATDFFDRREAAAVDAQRNGSSPEQVIAAMQQRRLHTMTAGDSESVFSGHPRRRLRPRTRTGSWDTVEHVLLCTDGFARIVTDYALYPRWNDVVDDARQHGLGYLEKRIRAAEHATTGVVAARFKTADDLAALLATARDPYHQSPRQTGTTPA